MTITTRKDAHIELCLEQSVESGLSSGLAGLTLEYDALPEIDLDGVDPSVEVFGKRLRAPLVIGAMTGGSPRAGELNGRLARAAARAGVGMALGSQRAMLSDPDLVSTYAVKRQAPQLPLLIGNVGAVQLNYGVTPTQIQKALDAVQADAVNFHLNPLQEAIQPEGDTRFAGLLQKLGACIEQLGTPALVKEVGAGISARTAQKLARLPLAGVEVAGVGGTSWAKVESYRAPEASVQAEVGRRLAGFGVPTLSSLLACRAHLPKAFTLVCSGGIRGGMEIAVSLALGADLVALAKPLLEAAAQSEDAAYHALQTLIYELRVICFCTGAKTIADLKKVRVLDARTGQVVSTTTENAV